MVESVWCGAEFFEEMMSLVFNLTSERISDRMWQTLPMLYDLFNKDNTDYFTGTLLSSRRQFNADVRIYFS